MPKPRDRITDQQQRLVDAYFGAANFVKTRALAMANYSQPNKQLAVFNQPAVKAEIKRRQAKFRKEHEVTFERLQQELMKIALFNPLSVMAPDPDRPGWFVVDLASAEAKDMAALGEIEIKEFWEGKGEDKVKVQRIRFKPWNKVTAIEQLIRHSGLSRDRTAENALGALADRIVAARRRAAPVERKMPLLENSDAD